MPQKLQNGGEIEGFPFLIVQNITNSSFDVLYKKLYFLVFLLFILYILFLL